MRKTHWTSKVLCLSVATSFVVAGCATEESIDELDGHGAYGKSDEFYSDYSTLLVNDAAASLEYGNCEAVKEVNGRALAAEIGYDYGEVIEEMVEQVRLAGFRKATAVLAGMKFYKHGDAYEPLRLPQEYFGLPNFIEYYDHVARLNKSIETQREFMEAGFTADSEDAADISRYAANLQSEATRVRDELKRLVWFETHTVWNQRNPESLQRQRAELEQQLLNINSMLEGIDGQRTDRRREYQSQIKAAAFEVEVLKNMIDWTRVFSGTDIWALGDAKAFYNALDPLQPISARERIAQLYAQYPILSTDDSWLWSWNDLAHRVYQVVAPDHEPPSHFADGIVSVADAGIDFNEHVNDAAIAEYVQDNLYPIISEIATSKHNQAVQNHIDWAFTEWQNIVNAELIKLPSRPADELMEYTDLVDEALARSADPKRQIWLAEYCASEWRRELIEYGKIAFYIGVGVAAGVSAFLWTNSGRHSPRHCVEYGVCGGCCGIGH